MFNLVDNAMANPLDNMLSKDKFPAVNRLKENGLKLENISTKL